MKHILSIRGGGIRGIIPCCCLIKLEEQLGGLTRDHIDFCAGTSTGALLTAAVVAGIPASQLLNVYTERSKEIFTPTGLEAEGKRVLKGYMFDPKNLEKVLVSEFGAASTWVINNSPIRMMISATAMNGHNWFFVRDNAINEGTTGNVKLVDAAVASACAPTYFDHWQVQIGDKLIYFFDGGVGGTANPTYQAAVEAFVYDTLDPADTKIIELGTGFYPQSNDPPKGFIGTIGWTTGTLVDSSEDWVDGAVKLKWGDQILQYFNPELPSNIDQADLSAIPTLVQVGEELAATLDWHQILA